MPEVFQFPVKFLINGAPKTLDSEYTVLNYKGSAYVPIRFIAESLLSKVYYTEEQERIISINAPFMELPQEYPRELARLNGDIVYVSQKLAYNEEQLANFIKNVKANVKDWIRIVRYTPEGDPIIQTVSYDSGKFKYVVDATRDKFGGDPVRESACSSLESSHDVLGDIPYTEFSLQGCGEQKRTVSLYRLFEK
ncbi:DUF4362 domain-containing protein [Paenibacillus ginsengarvi]|uniref:DUF4362 domain-containing protein n=1 Tax=Paenibacillus ginsengarvi TaxID=400777 RepID=A0A3B0AQ17_9BACL|nr:DUF4362 domain-containing protein [Paenibacillus ginsengarvi]RKN62900.1 DUF4362 domain-containing protein [Paenibacillus ginsengarvi]